MPSGRRAGALLVALWSASCSSDPLPGDGTREGGAVGGSPGVSGPAGSGDVIAKVRASCTAATLAFCQSVYRCFATEELPGVDLPPTLEECQTEFFLELGCDRPLPGDFCATSERYSLTAAQRCIDQSQVASCEWIRTGGEFAPGCNEICGL